MSGFSRPMSASTTRTETIRSSVSSHQNVEEKAHSKENGVQWF